MSARIIEPANVTLDIAGKNLSIEKIVAEPKLSQPLKTAIINFTLAISKY